MTTHPSTALIFPGQGSQQVGMGQELSAAHPLARETFDVADEILGFPLSRLCFEGPKANLDETINTQPALYVTSVALWRVAQAEGRLPEPAFLAGHSLGEYSALTAAGALPFEAGVRLVRARGEAMRAAGERAPGAMAAVLGGDDALVAEICATLTAEGQAVQVANYNCPGQLVISGAKDAVAQASSQLQARGIKRVIPLDVSIAAHSALMAPAVEGFAALVEAAPLQPPTLPVIANLTARPLNDVAAIRAELVGQLTGSVRWTETVAFLLDAGVQHFIEIGPGNVLTGLVKRVSRDATRTNIASWADIVPSTPSTEKAS